MNLISHLLVLSDHYAAARGLSRSRVSTILFDDGKVLNRLADGADITVGRMERAVSWLSANWPEGVDWPEGILRPAPPGIAAE